MTLQQAIAHLTILTTAHGDRIHPLELEAARLAIEALQAIITFRTSGDDEALWNLPGEPEE